MGVDRGRRGGGSAGQNGYGREQQPNGHRSGWGRETDSRYNEEWPVGNGYDKYDQHERGNGGRRGGGADENGHSGGGGRGGGGHSQAGHNGHAPDSEVLPQALIESIEKKISSTHSDMTQELHAITRKENEKFDLIFGILIELQRRQAQLEESVQSLRTQLPGGGMMQPQQQSLGQSQPAQASAGQNFVPQGNQMSNQMGNQMSNQMGNQMNGQMVMPNQMNMGQQYGNMMASDGSQAYFSGGQNVVLVAQPVGMAPPQGGVQVGQGMQGMQQMPYAMPQMMSGPMQPQMAVQYVGQDQPNFQQWAGSENAQQEPEIPDGLSTHRRSQSAGGQMGGTPPLPDTPEAPEDGFAAPEEVVPVVEGDEKAALDEGDKAEIRIEEE